MREQIKQNWVQRVRHDRWMDQIIFGFADTFPSELQEVGSTEMRRNYKCADVLEAAGVSIQYPKGFRDQLSVPSGNPELRPSNTAVLNKPNPGNTK